MDNGPDWVILLMYWSHDMRHIGFRRLTVVNGTPGIGASHLVSLSQFPHTCSQTRLFFSPYYKKNSDLQHKFCNGQICCKIVSVLQPNANESVISKL